MHALNDWIGRALAVALLGASAGVAAAAEPRTAMPEAAPEGLSALGEALRLPNPYRGLPAAVAAGEQAYGRHCAVCHGAGAVQPSAEAPELRRLDTFCRRLQDPPLQHRCLTDVDAYFMRSVLEGKRRAGLMHMPAWAGVLPQETIWAIRSFTATRPPAAPRTLPDLPPVAP